MLITVMYFGLNEACKRNHVVFHNQLTPGSILDIYCRNNHGRIRTQKLNFNVTPYIVDFKDYVWPEKTAWYCVISHGPSLMFHYDLEAYHTKDKRCGQLRSWIARPDRDLVPPGHVLNWKKH